MDDYEKRVNAQKAEAGREARDRQVVITSLGQHPQGRKFLWWILELGNTFGGSYRVDASGRHDPGASARAEGRREYGLDVMNEIIRCSPELFTTMMKEQNVRSAARPDTTADPDADSEPGTDTSSRANAGSNPRTVAARTEAS